jgi:hypothetical protein
VPSGSRFSERHDTQPRRRIDSHGHRNGQRRTHIGEHSNLNRHVDAKIRRNARNTDRNRAR